MRAGWLARSRKLAKTRGEVSGRAGAAPITGGAVNIAIECDTPSMIERVLRTANGFAEASKLDRDDVAAMTFEERISEVERLRRIWFGEDRAESRPHKVFITNLAWSGLLLSRRSP
jgi:predicted Rdx family selenoprotein